MKNKKTIMAISALMILIFHLWICVTNSYVEVFIKQMCVIGVDLFFFVSIYSIQRKKTINYKEFIISRFNSVYFKFIVLTMIYEFCSNGSMNSFVKTILGIDLLKRGGGSFLWFLPAIMIIYILMPLYKKFDTKYPKIVPFVSIISYLTLSILISLFTNYNAIFILLNRVPIMLLGYYFAKYDVIEKLNSSRFIYMMTTFILIIIGIIISYNVVINHFRVEWLYDIFYILYIPLEIGLILLFDKIKDNKLSTLIGSITLELYGLQMIFGFKITNDIYKLVNNVIITNITVIIILIILSIILKNIFLLKDRLISKLKII